MLFLADTVRAATAGAVTCSGPRRADVRSRACAGEKLLSPITSKGNTFFVRHHADATDSEVLIFALFIVLLESSAEDTAEWAAGLAPLAAQAADEQAGWATAVGRRTERCFLFAPQPAVPARQARLPARYTWYTSPAHTRAQT